MNTNTAINSNNSLPNHEPEMLPDKSELDKNLFLGGSTVSNDKKSEPCDKEGQVETNTASVVVPDSDNCKMEAFSGNLEGKESEPSKPDENSNSETLKEASTTDNVSIENNPQPEKMDLDNDYLHSKKSVVEKDVEESQSAIKNCDHDENFNITVIKEECKEKKALSPSVDNLETSVMSENSNAELRNSHEERTILPKVVEHDDHSNHEDTILNDENHLPKKTDLENITNEIGLNRIALRIRKPQDTSNKLSENDKNVQFYVADKDDVKNPIIKKSSKKRKVKQENRKNENMIGDTKMSYKIDNDSKIQKTSLLNNVKKEKDINRSLCMITTCYDGIKKSNSIQTEAHENAFCIDEKQLEETSVDGIPAARLRLRDTPKTSVKRVCPCCVDSKLPKKCRANGGGSITKIIGTKVSNNMKSKSTLKTRNATNGHNGKVNTRSSQRLRSRNNAIS